MLKVIYFILALVFAIINALRNYQSILSIIFSILIFLWLSGLILYYGNFNKKSIFLSIIFSLITGLLIINKCLISYHYTEINIKNISKDPIVIDSVYLDGLKCKINNNYQKKSNIKKNTSNTEYDIQNKNTSIYKVTLMPNKEYNINLRKVKSVEIEIGRPRQTTSILINGKKIKLKALDYKKITNKAKKVGNYNYKYSFQNGYIKLNGIINLFLVLLIAILNFILLNFSFKRKISALYLLLLILEFNPIVSFSLVSKLIITILFLILYNIDASKNDDKNIKFIFVLSSLYISFSFFGKYLIDYFSLVNLLYYLVLSLFIYILFPKFIMIWSLIKNKSIVENNTKKITKHRVILFCVTVIILVLYQVAFYPFIYLTDLRMQVLEIGSNTISNWQPYIHTYLLKLCYYIFNSYTPFIYFRILIYAGITNFVMYYFYQKGMSLLKFYLFPILFTVLPTTGVVMVTLLKDVDFAICLFLLSFYLYVIYNDFSYFDSRKYNYFLLLLSLIGVGFFRTNGFYVSVVISLLLIYFSIKNMRKNLYFTMIIFIIISVFIKIPLTKILKVEKAPPNLEVATILHGFDYLITYHKEELSSSTFKYLTSIISYQDYKLYYDKYNIDVLLHYNSDYESKKVRNLHINKVKLVTCYIRQFFKSPVYLLKDRLYGTDIIWDIIEEDKIKELNYQTLYDEFGTSYKDENIKVKSDSKLITKVLQLISENTFLNIIFFRMGIYIDILIVLINYQIINKNKKSLVCLIPLLITLLTLFIAMHYQTVRYLYMLPGVFIIFVLIVFYGNDEKRKN